MKHILILPVFISSHCLLFAQTNTGLWTNMEALNAKMVVDHYMQEYHENGKFYFEVYDGKEIRKSLGQEKSVFISKNQKYYATALFSGEQECDDCMVEVTLFNIMGNILAKGSVKGVYGFEGALGLLPFDDGKRFILYGKSTTLPFFAIYRAQPDGEGFVQDFRYGRDQLNYYGEFLLSEKQERILVTRGSTWHNKLKVDTLSLMCYNLKGKLLWKSMFWDMNAGSPMFISDDDGSFTFTTSTKPILKMPSQETLSQTFFDREGHRIYEYEIAGIGDYDICHYKKMGDTLYFVYTNGRNEIKITNLKNLNTVGRNWEDNLTFGDIVLHQGKAIYTRLKRSVTNSKGDKVTYTPASDHKIIIDDLKSTPVVYPIKGIEFPLIVENMGNVFIGEKYKDRKIDFRKYFYKIKIK
jgi:hypothetical protein